MSRQTPSHVPERGGDVPRRVLVGRAGAVRVRGDAARRRLRAAQVEARRRAVDLHNYDYINCWYVALVLKTSGLLIDIY